MSKYTVTIGDDIIEYTVYDTVTFDAATVAYDKIVDAALPSIVDDDGVRQTVFAPFMRDIAADYAIIRLFTDINLEGRTNEEIWALSKYTDVIANIMSDETRARIIRDIYRWVDEFVGDYKARILANAKRDELYEALANAVTPSEESLSNADELSSVLQKLRGISEEDMLDAIIKAGKE